MQRGDEENVSPQHAPDNMGSSTGAKDNEKPDKSKALNPLLDSEDLKEIKLTNEEVEAIILSDPDEEDANG